MSSPPTVMDQPTRALTIYGGYETNNNYNWSPFTTKLEARLRFSNRPYDVRAGSFSKAPKGKVPYIHLEGSRSGKPALTMGDSTLIAQRLIVMGEVDDLNSVLSPSQKAQDLMVRTLVEEKLYWIMLHERFLQGQNFYRFRDEGPLSSIPYAVRLVVGGIVGRGVAKALQAQGTGRHTVEELDQMSEEAWAALNDLCTAHTTSTLDDGQVAATSKRMPWIFGGQDPTEADASLYGLLVAVFVGATPKMKKMVQNYPALINYADRIHETYFSQYAKWQS
ncbi:MAG: hypothetical protein M1816_006212 [Peltula sp. TS41687]|nr:MAG: hypothetical protein M1816_006212 [Peltula sp. TS41687]